MRGKHYLGFTLIELLISLTIIALLISIAAPRYFQSVDRSKDVVLMENLKILRKTIDAFYEDHGIYPKDLNELVVKRYLREIPKDPITGLNDTWIIERVDGSNASGVFDVKSGAEGSSLNGTPYIQL